MRHSKFSSPQVNSGSMADIAFLLLIFFLVSTTISSDQGFNRRLPKECPQNVDCSNEINERNILRIAINDKNEIMLNENIIAVSQLKQIVKDFVDNNGDNSCNYCNGKKLTNSSDNPKEAVISLQTQNLTTYGQYIVVQDELTKAYYELRENYTKNVLGKTTNKLTNEEIKVVKDAYPFILSEAETK